MSVANRLVAACNSQLKIINKKKKQKNKEPNTHTNSQPLHAFYLLPQFFFNSFQYDSIKRDIIAYTHTHQNLYRTCGTARL